MPRPPEHTAAYRARLQAFDWSFEFSDDASLVRAARAELNDMKRLQPAIDPTGEIWNSIAPPEHRLV